MDQSVRCIILYRACTVWAWLKELGPVLQEAVAAWPVSLCMLPVVPESVATWQHSCSKLPKQWWSACVVLRGPVKSVFFSHFKLYWLQRVRRYFACVMIIIDFFPPSRQQFIIATLHAYSEVTLYGWLSVNIQLLTKPTTYNPCVFWGDSVLMSSC